MLVLCGLALWRRTPAKSSKRWWQHVELTLEHLAASLDTWWKTLWPHLKIQVSLTQQFFMFWSVAYSSAVIRIPMLTSSIQVYIVPIFQSFQTYADQFGWIPFIKESSCTPQTLHADEREELSLHFNGLMRFEKWLIYALDSLDDPDMLAV